MNRRLVVRCAVSCFALCLVAWRLPPMLDKAFASIDEHRGTISLLSAEGVTMPGVPDAPTSDGIEIFAASGATLTPEQRARLLEAARRHDPLAQVKASERAAPKPATPTAPATSTAPAPSGAAPARTVEDVLRELGLDPASFDPKALDLDARSRRPATARWRPSRNPDARHPIPSFARFSAHSACSRLLSVESSAAPLRRASISSRVRRTLSSS